MTDKKKAEKHPEVLTIDGTAEYLQISRRKVYKLLEEHAIPAQRVGQRWRFSKKALEKWLEGEGPRK